MRNAIVLRKIHGVFDACWSFGSRPAQHINARRASLSQTVGFFAAVIAPFMLILVLLASLLFFKHSPSTAGSMLSMKSLGLATMAGTVATQETIDALQRAFNTFKDANDDRLKQLETKGSVDPLLNSKVDKANSDITDLQNKLKAQTDELKEMQKLAARVAPMSSGEARDKEVLNARSFYSLVRHARVTDVTDDEMVAYRAFTAAQATYLRAGPEAVARDSNLQAALSTGANPSGGYWLTPETTNRIIEWIEDLSSLRSYCAVSPIGTDTYEGYYDLDEGDAGWVEEQAARSETLTPRIDGKFTFPISELYANPKTTQKMLDDSQNDVEGWLAKKVGMKMAKIENTAFVAGPASKGAPRGFLTYPAGTPSRSSVTTYRKIRQYSTGVSGDFVATPNGGDIFIDMIVGLPSELRKGAVFAMNQLTLAKVRKLKDSQGHYVFIPDFTVNPAGQINGHGIVELMDMPDVAANSLSIAFANFGEAYEIKDHRVGIRVLRDPYTAKPFVQFYTTKRVGGDVVNFQAINLLKFG